MTWHYHQRAELHPFWKEPFLKHNLRSNLFLNWRWWKKKRKNIDPESPPLPCCLFIYGFSSPPEKEEGMGSEQSEGHSGKKSDSTYHFTVKKTQVAPFLQGSTGRYCLNGTGALPFTARSLVKSLEVESSVRGTCSAVVFVPSRGTNLLSPILHILTVLSLFHKLTPCYVCSMHNITQKHQK